MASKKSSTSLYLMQIKQTESKHHQTMCILIYALKTLDCICDLMIHMNWLWSNSVTKNKDNK